MCGRYSIVADLFQLQTFFSLDEVEPWPTQPGRPEWQSRWNGAPTQTFPVIVAVPASGGGIKKVLRWMRWGLVPSWVKDEEALSIGSRMINARIESVTEKPSFRKAVALRRCVIPMSSFFEWHTDPEGTKEPFRIYSKAVPFLSVAGIFEEWKRHGASDSVPERMTTFSLLTCDANAFMERIHHRMPVVLEAEQQRRWLDPSVRTGSAALESLAGFRGEHPDWTSDRVSRLVNSPRNDRAEIWTPS